MTEGQSTAHPETLSLFSGEFAVNDRVAKVTAIKKKNFSARNKRIQIRFNELHNDKRIRYDDVMETLALEFCLAKSTILKALKSKE
jgi:hypothetical protein